MIALALFLAAMLCLAMASRGLGDTPQESNGAWLAALVFLLCLAGVIAHKKRASDDE